MKKHLIALDLDGTLLYDWKTLRPETADFLKAIKKQGHELVIATGRPYRSAIKFYNALDLNAPIINYNGGLVSWKENPDFEEINITVEKDAVIDIFNNNTDHIDNAFCEIKDDIYLMRESVDIMELLHFFGNATLSIGDFTETLPGDTNGVIIIAKENHGHLIEAYVAEHYPGKLMTRNWGSSYQFIIEVFTPHTNKGRALKHVAHTFGISRENILAFGDGHNDIEMLEYAGIGIAMSNAHPELKAIADVVSPYSNQEGAIETFLTSYFKNKKAVSD